MVSLKKEESIMMRIIVAIAALYGTLMFLSQYAWASAVALEGSGMNLTWGWIIALCVAGSAFALGKD